MLFANRKRSRGAFLSALLAVCLVNQAAPVSFAQQPAAKPAAAAQFESVPLAEKYKFGTKDYKQIENAKKEAFRGTFDITAVQNYYQFFVIPMMTSDDPTSVNQAVASIRLDMGSALKLPPDNLKKYNDLLFKYLPVIASKNFRPSAVINSILLIGEMSQEKASSSSSPDTPYAPALGFLLAAAEKGSNDGIKAAALVGLDRHVRISSASWSEQNRDALAAKLLSWAKKPKSPVQSPEAHAYLASRYLQLMDLFPHKKGSEAVEFATDTLANEFSHPMLREQALVILGYHQPTTTPPEKSIAAGRYTLRYLKRQLEDWNELYELAASAGGAAGGGGGGYEGAGGGYGSGYGDKASESMEGYGGVGGGYGGSGTEEKAKPKPEEGYKKQDAQTVVLRRYMHELIQRVRYGLTGEMAGEIGSEFKTGLLVNVPDGEEKDLLKHALKTMKDVQVALNDEKIQAKSDMAATVAPLVEILKATAESYPGAIDLENERLIEEVVAPAAPVAPELAEDSKGEPAPTASVNPEAGPAPAQ